MSYAIIILVSVKDDDFTNRRRKFMPAKLIHNYQLEDGHPFKGGAIIFGSSIPESYKKRMAALKKEQSESSTTTSPEVSEERSKES